MKYKCRFKCRLLFTLAILHLAFLINGQITFQKVYPTTYDKDSREVLPTPDGGYIIAGMTNNADITDCDLYVMKTDYAGEFVWGKIYGGAKPDYAYGIIETGDGNYFVIGYSQSFGGGDMDAYLLKIDPLGNVIWEKTYIGFGYDEGREIIKTQDGNFVIVGSTNSNLSSQDAFLMKIDLTGAVIWIKYYGGNAVEFGNSVQECPDGGLILTGQTFSYGQGGDAFLVRTNANGDTLWTKHFGGALADEGVSVIANNDNTFALAIRDSCNGKDVDIRIIKTDGTGAITWSKLYSGAQKDTPKKLRATNDGGYIVGAISRSFGWINPDIWILKLNSSGDTTWSRHFGSSDHEHCHDIKQSSDGGYLVAGHSRSFSPSRKIMFLKLNSDGLVSIEEQTHAYLNFNIYPNPCSDGMITINVEKNILCKIKIFNALGQVVFLETELLKPDEPKIIELKNKQPGLYFISMESENNKTMGKIILQ